MYFFIVAVIGAILNTLSLVSAAVVVSSSPATWCSKHFLYLCIFPMQQEILHINLHSHLA